jgi:hypothetical protein
MSYDRSPTSNQNITHLLLDATRNVAERIELEKRLDTCRQEGIHLQVQLQRAYREKHEQDLLRNRIPNFFIGEAVDKDQEASESSVEPDASDFYASDSDEDDEQSSDFSIYTYTRPEPGEPEDSPFDDSASNDSTYQDSPSDES